MTEIQASFTCHRCKVYRELTSHGNPNDADTVLESLAMQLRQEGWRIGWGSELLGKESDMAGLIVALCPNCATSC